MKKKHFRIIIVSFIIFSIISTSNKSEASDNLSVYNNYIVENLDDIKHIVEFTENCNYNCNIVVKNGFMVNDTMIYPVMKNEELVSYLTVYYDELNSLNWTLTGILPDYKIKGIDEQDGLIEFYKLNRIIINKSKLNSNFLEIESKPSYINLNNINNSNISTLSSNTRLLSLRIIETQGSKPWCAAYAASAIINTKDRSQTTTASSIINYFSSSSGLTDNQILAYSQYRGYKTSIEGTLSMNKIRGQINNNSPIYLAGNRYESGVKKGRHAFVLSGYDVGSSKAYAWNPWGSYTWFSISSKSIPAGSVSYKWDLSITGWNK